MRPAEGEVGREDEEALDERDEEDGDDDQRDRLDELPHRSAHEDQRREGGDGGEDGEDDGDADLAGAVDGRREVRFSELALLVDVLADDDGVVHDDPQRQDEGEEGDHVDGDPKDRHQKERPEEGDGDAEHDPQGEADLEKEPQDDEDEDEADGGVLQKQVPAALEELARVVPGGDPHRRRQQLALSLHVIVDDARDLRRLLLADPEDLHHRRRLAVEGGRRVGLLEGVAHGGDVAEAHQGAVGLGEDDDVGVLRADVAPLLGAQQDLPPFGADRSAGQIEGGAAHLLRNLVKGEIVTPQVLFGDLDGDLVGAHSAEVDLGNLLESEEVVAHDFGPFAQAALGDVAIDDDRDDLAPGEELGDQRLLGVKGKGRDAVDLALDVLQHRVGIGPLADLDQNPPHPLGGCRLDLLDPVDP